MRSLLSFLRASFLWVLLLPPAAAYTGFALNEAVLVANHDTFPVLARDSAAATMLPDAEGHVVMTHETHLNFLADWIDVGDGWESPGDEFIALGRWLHAFCPMLYLVLVTTQLVSDSNAKKR